MGSNADKRGKYSAGEDSAGQNGDGRRSRRRKVGGALAPQHRRPRLDPDSAAIRRAVADCLPDEPGQFIVAVSGGPDSAALAAACAHLNASTHHSFTAVIVDHGLQSGSAHIAVRAAGMVAGLGLPAIVRTVKVERTASGLEADARSARYGALEEARIAFGAQAVLTGHTRDDQAETVLLGMLRGSGSRALAGMRPYAGTVWRPLLGIERRQTVASAYAQRLPVWHDPMNRDPDYMRVNVRQRVLPALTDHLGEGVKANLARTAELAAFDADYLDRRAARMAESLIEADHLSAQTAQLPPALGTRVIQKWLHQQLRTPDQLSAEHVLGAWRALGGGPQPLSMPGGMSLERTDRGDLRLVPGDRPKHRSDKGFPHQAEGQRVC